MQFDFIKYNFAHVVDRDPCCLLGNDSTQGVMINFMCQLDWATGCPDIWLTLF